MLSQSEGDVGRVGHGGEVRVVEQVRYLLPADDDYGPSQVVCLKCGHMFCSQCIAMSLRVSSLLSCNE